MSQIRHAIKRANRYKTSAPRMDETHSFQRLEKPKTRRSIWSDITVVVVILSLIGGWGFGAYRFFTRNKEAAGDPASNGGTADKTGKNADYVHEEGAGSGGLRDALKKLAGSDDKKNQPVDTSSYKLTGIFRSGGEDKALINGSIVTVGDYVSGARVDRIDGNKVVLVKNGKEIPLKML